MTVDVLNNDLSSTVMALRGIVSSKPSPPCLLERIGTLLFHAFHALTPTTVTSTYSRSADWDAARLRHESHCDLYRGTYFYRASGPNAIFPCSSTVKVPRNTLELLARPTVWTATGTNCDGLRTDMSQGNLLVDLLALVHDEDEARASLGRSK